jgi:hypothetical protein
MEHVASTMSQRVHPTVEWNQVAAVDTALDRPLPEAGDEKLPPRHHAVLAFGEPSNQPGRLFAG